MESKGFMRGNLVITENGPQPIETIKVGDMVLTHKNKFEKVIAINKKQVSGNYRLQVQGSPATFVHGNQLFYVREKKSNKLNKDTNISERQFTEAKWKKAKDLKKTDFIMMGKINKQKTDIELSENDCWLLGKFLIKNYISYKDKTVTIYIKNIYEKKLQNLLNSYDYVLTKVKDMYKLTIKDKYFYEICTKFKFKKEEIIPIDILYLSDKKQDIFLKSYSEDKGKFADEYYILKDKSKKIIYQLGIMVANINSYGGYSLFIDGVESFRIQYKDNVPKSANFVRIDKRLWQPVRQLDEIKAFRGTVYNLVTEESGSFCVNNLISK